MCRIFSVNLKGVKNRIVPTRKFHFFFAKPYDELFNIVFAPDIRKATNQRLA